MTIATILCPVDGLPGSEAALEAAIAVGRTFNAHVTLLHVEVPPESAVPMVGEGMTGAVIEEIMESARKNAQERAKTARALFDRHCAEPGLALAEEDAAPEAGRFTVAWTHIRGIESDQVAARGKLFDLLVLARPNGEASGRFGDSLEAAIFDSGRPVMMVPSPSTATAWPTIAIAWRDTKESARGLASALPFLRKAERVLLLTVAEGGASADLTQGRRYLAYHGINAESRTLEPGERSAGDAILAEAKAEGAELLVMGAYSHSRLRQLVLGGMTRDVLERAEIAVLMAH